MYSTALPENQPSNLTLLISSLVCHEKTRLLNNYGNMALALSVAVADLNERVGTTSKAVYDAMELKATDARTRAKQARIDLEKHLAEHHC